MQKRPEAAQSVSVVFYRNVAANFRPLLRLLTVLRLLPFALAIGYVYNFVRFYGYIKLEMTKITIGLTRQDYAL